jgi:hypothetical protein
MHITSDHEHRSCYPSEAAAMAKAIEAARLISQPTGFTVGESHYQALGTPNGEVYAGVVHEGGGSFYVVIRHPRSRQLIGYLNTADGDA